MEILNYTGKRVGLTNSSGSPSKMLSSQGNAHFDEIAVTPLKNVDGIFIYSQKLGNVRGLPSPDRNQEKFYIVPKEIAEYLKKVRFDLLVAEEPFIWEGGTFYKRLANYHSNKCCFEATNW
jgi:hypothetical protein